LATQDPKAVKAADKGELLRCPVCQKILAVKTGTGRYEVENKGRSGKNGSVFRQVIYAGTVFCAHCGFGQPIPPLQTKQPKQPSMAAVKSKEAKNGQ
jgi:C4-type Zn-finger protein